MTIALKNPAQYRSVSAFAPISAPMQCAWGKKALTNYLGPEQTRWRDYDASDLMARKAFPAPILVDQGTADQFQAEFSLNDIFRDVPQADRQRDLP